jgi:hypothetical protein
MSRRTKLFLLIGFAVVGVGGVVALSAAKRTHAKIGNNSSSDTRFDIRRRGTSGGNTRIGIKRHGAVAHFCGISY